MSDDGIGMSVGLSARLFESFSRVRDTTGGKPGEGSAFRVTPTHRTAGRPGEPAEPEDAGIQVERAACVQTLQAAETNIPIVALTANAFEEDRRKAFEAGMNAHLAKPIDVARLKEALTSLLRR